MENRFGLKDLFVIILLILLILSVWLAMKQFDRQWKDVQEVKTSVGELTGEQARLRNQISELRRLIQSGVRVNDSAAAGDTPEQYDPFEGVRAAREKEGFAQGDWCIDVFGTNVSIITALTYKDLYGRLIQAQVLESLITIDPNTLENVPQIAESWKIQDNSDAWRQYMDQATEKFAKQADADASVFTEQLKKLVSKIEGDSGPVAEGSEQYKALTAKARQQWIDAQIDADPNRPPATVITFKLRDDVVFSDGAPLTAEDVVFTWELLNNPKLDAASTRQFYDNIETCKALGKYEVQFGMTEPHYMALSMCGGRPVLPKHFYSKYTIDQINRMPGLLMGTGPYRLPDPAAWAPGKPLELVRNERYWGPQGGFDKLVYREIINDVARVTAFKNGEIDMLAPTPEQFESLKDDPAVAERTQHFVYQSIPTGYMWLAWQQKRSDKPTMFADKRVRQAMTYLTERRRICDDVFHGYATPAMGPWPKGSKQADPSLEPRPYDPEKGKALLAEVGWKDRDGDGVLENAEGKPFQFTLTYPSGSADYDRIALFLKDSYAKAGIVMELDPLEFSVLIQRLEQQTFDAIILRWGGGAVESDIRQMFHSSQANKGGDNVMNYISPELDRLIDKARSTVNPDERYPLWQECHRILYDDQPYTFMLYQKSLRMFDKRIANIQRNKMGLNDPPRNEWYVPAPLQKWGK
ncbi:ABC transporter substrate-binding protein [Planctomycetales bacterium ZRK34]|nr:ABC transporter substrate-binding protein [Planctomycetales bacterium ZRK34]